MIQRIQSVWLFLAAMLNGLLFIFPLYRYNNPNPVYSPWQVEGVKGYLPLFILATIITILPLITIFLFGDRKRQRRFVWITMISTLSFIGMVVLRISNLKNSTPPISNFEYLLPGILVSFVALIFLFLALRGINKDEKLIRSMDRLR